MLTFDVFDSRQEEGRLYSRGPQFRELWDDLREAEAARLRFETRDLRDAARADEFRHRRDELAEEVERDIARRGGT